MINRLWNSPTLVSWAALCFRFSSTLLVWPVALSTLSTNEIAAWALFSSVMMLQAIIDSSFSDTFMRILSYARAGRSDYQHRDDAVGAVYDRAHISGSSENPQPNWSEIRAICGTMRAIYTGLALFAFLAMATLGTWSVLTPLSYLSNPAEGHAAWLVCVVACTMTIWGNQFHAYLMGMNRVVLAKRVELLASVCSTLLSLLVLLFGGGLLSFILASQSVVFIQAAAFRFFAGRVSTAQIDELAHIRFNREVFDKTWPIAWRSWLGVLVSVGAVQVSAIVYANLVRPSESGSFLVGQRLLQIMATVAQVPFYTKLPLLSQFAASGNKEQLAAAASRSMRLVYWIFVAGFAALFFLGRDSLQLIKSNIEFPNQLLWTLMALGFFLDRVSGMHIQIYTTTNRIIWHTASLIQGVVYVAVAFLLYPRFQVLALPIASIIANGPAAAVFSGWHSYRYLRLQFPKFEFRTSGIPFAIMVLLLALSFYTTR